MIKKHYLEKFKPPEFNLDRRYIYKLNEITNVQWNYVSSGRASIYHIIKCNNIKTIYIPVYICNSVLEPLKKLKVKIYFYDLDLKDLNPSFKSFKELYKKNPSDAVLVASMYGNPADLLKFEEYCLENNIYMIDDAAQSFGAKLNGRYVGMFGNAGFFSFSPGKPLAGHLGSFFRMDKDCKIKQKSNYLYHYFKWKYFKNNRLNIYSTNKLKFIFYEIIHKIMNKFFFKYDDGISNFEIAILGGILQAHFENKWMFRKRFFNKILDLNFKKMRLVKNIRGDNNPHKLVFIVKNQEVKKEFAKILRRNRIYFINGYKLLDHSLDFKNAKLVDGLIFELPLEDDKEKMKFLYKVIKDFDENY